MEKLVLGVRGPLLELIRELMLAWFTHPARRRARWAELMRYRVRHVTEYRYSREVINGHTVAHLRPRRTPTQTVISSEVTTLPDADHADEYVDSFGNHVSYRAVEQVHDQLVVTGNYEVDLVPPEPLVWSPPWEQLRDLVAHMAVPTGCWRGRARSSRLWSLRRRIWRASRRGRSCRAERFTRRSSTCRTASSASSLSIRVSAMSVRRWPMC